MALHAKRRMVGTVDPNGKKCLVRRPCVMQCHRHQHGPGRFLQWQVGFFTIIVQPTFALLAELQHRVKARAPSGVIVFW